MLDRKPRIGIVGLGRGDSFFSLISECGGELVAVCDTNTSKFKKVIPYMAPCGGYYQDYDEFLKCDLDGVILTNYFTEHAEFAIKAMKAGKAVLTECTAAVTMAQCVKLLRAQEETGMIYMLAENYPYASSNQEMRRVYKSGRLGEAVYAEGEYVHYLNNEELIGIAPGMNHWRRYLAKTYYSTHSMAPLMYATDLEPKNVVSFAACIDELAENDSRFSGDSCAQMLVEMDNGSIFRVCGNVSFGQPGDWYRIDCTDGGIETVRGDRPQIRLNFRDDILPAGVSKAEQYYTPDFPEDSEAAKATGHSGGDYFIIRNFIRHIKDGTEPYFNVKKSVKLSELGILAWRSVLSGGTRFEIPDLSNEHERKRWENDDFSPFPNVTTGEGPTLPCCSKNIKTKYYDKKEGK